MQTNGWAKTYKPFKTELECCKIKGFNVYVLCVSFCKTNEIGGNDVWEYVLYVFYM